MKVNSRFAFVGQILFFFGLLLFYLVGIETAAIHKFISFAFRSDLQLVGLFLFLTLSAFSWSNYERGPNEQIE